MGPACICEDKPRWRSHDRLSERIAFSNCRITDQLVKDRNQVRMCPSSVAAHTPLHYFYVAHPPSTPSIPVNPVLVQTRTIEVGSGPSEAHGNSGSSVPSPGFTEFH
jgi:hypothetical protein